MNTQTVSGVQKKQSRIIGTLRYVDRTGGTDATDYPGSYTVTPALTAQQMQTAGYMMRENVQIEAIPIESVSNTAGGNTVIIG